MQLRICATVAWSCSPNTLSGLFWNWGACGFSAAIVFAASAASRAKCSLRAASRNVHQTGIDRWLGRSILPSGSRPASRAISLARSWYGSDRSMPCTWLLPPADATLRARRFRNEPVGLACFLSLSPPCQLFLRSRPEHGRPIPWADSCSLLGLTPVLNLRSAHGDHAHRHRTGV